MSVTPTEDRASICAAQDRAQIREKWTNRFVIRTTKTETRSDGDDHLAAGVAGFEVSHRISGVCQGIRAIDDGGELS